MVRSTATARISAKKKMAAKMPSARNVDATDGRLQPGEMKLEDPDFESADRDQGPPAPHPKGQRSSDAVREVETRRLAHQPQSEVDGEFEDDFIYERIAGDERQPEAMDEDEDEDEVEEEEEEEEGEGEEKDAAAASGSSITPRSLTTAALKLAIATGDVAAVRSCFAAVVPEVISHGVHVALPRAIVPCSGTAAELVDACKAAIHSAKAKAGGARHGTGQMRVLIVTPSAPRAASLCSILSQKVHGLRVAKLFGRHLDLDAQAAFLSANRVDVAIGTPSRLAALGRAGVLDLTLLRHAMCDLTPDEKEMTFLSLSKHGARRPDGDALSEMLQAEPFATCLRERPGRRSKLVLAPVLLPDRQALEAATPRSQLAGRGHPGGGRHRGGGGHGRGRGGAALRGAIGKPRPRPSAFASRTGRLA